jgi:hypothetical protein
MTLTLGTLATALDQQLTISLSPTAAPKTTLVAVSTAVQPAAVLARVSVAVLWVVWQQGLVHLAAAEWVAACTMARYQMTRHCMACTIRSTMHSSTVSSSTISCRGLQQATPIAIISMRQQEHQQAPPAAAAEGVIDEETGAPDPAAAAGRGSRVSFSTDVTDHSQQHRQQGINSSSASATPHPAAAFNPGAYTGPIRKAFGSFTGVGGMLLRRSTTNNTSLETPRLPYNPAADPNNAVFCDYETAGVYDPSR